MFDSRSNAGIPSQTQVCIAGGGPAGLMLGYLLARQGVEVVVLEKHRDFLRDFRGDTVHPSTLQVMRELGLLDEFLKQPHEKVRTISATVGHEKVVVGDFSHVKTGCPYVVLMPQWDFLNFIMRKAQLCPTFHLGMECAVQDLVIEKNQVVGVRVKTPEGERTVQANLVVGADGRHSVVRAKAGLTVEDLGAPMDVLWLRLPRKPGDDTDPGGTFQNGRIFVMIPRTDYWQCAFLIAKGRYDEVRAAGIPAFRQALCDLVPFLKDRVGELQSWDQVSLLTVAVDRLTKWWRPGLLCIGDAAHAMSPIGGVGINLAIQDAVATANILGEALRAKEAVSASLLRRVQTRREFPTRVTQAVQVFIQNRVITRTLHGEGVGASGGLPWPLKLAKLLPMLRRLPARAVGVGVRPEHVHAAAF